MNLLELEKSENMIMMKRCIAEIIAAADEDIAAIFTDCSDRGYDEVMDQILISKYGRRDVSEYMLTEITESLYGKIYKKSIKSYLIEKAFYIRQCLAYEKAEYNPIENYSQTEHETTDTTIGVRDFTDTNTENPYSREVEHDYEQHEKTTLTPQIITENYTEADIKTERDQLLSTVETKNAPFESSTYFNKEKVETTPGKITDTEKPYNRKTKTPQFTITDTDQAHKITDTESLAASKVDTHRHLSEEAEDGVVRDLTRSGNIGVQTAAQMMMLDASWWSSHTWLSDLIRGIVDLLCEDVIAV